MRLNVQHRILSQTGAEAIERTEVIQPLWNDYGTLTRVHLCGGPHASVIMKHIQIPEQLQHPRGFATDMSRRRKIRSYQIEMHWYRNLNDCLGDGAPTPDCLDAFSDGQDLFLLLEDLHCRGFDRVHNGVQWAEMLVVLEWLAAFHATFIGDPAEGLWPSGTYWHLQTRPDELAVIDGTRLHRYAALIDARLRCSAFSTIVHGDAKLANFLFSGDRLRVAAVDFQYVGRGPAMKDVAYFVGSCLSGSECERRETVILDRYFDALRRHLPASVDAELIETDWRPLYPIAWADFERFMLGWSPGHRKLTDYSDATTNRALEFITDELLTAATAAARAAGSFIMASRGQPLSVQSKGMASPAADAVTEIDVAAQAIIAEHLAETVQRYDLGVLAEEGAHDDSRMRKHAFWAVDPLDGTQNFVEGKTGFATSIALVSQQGETLLGVVYDPVNDRLYEAVKGGGVKVNGSPMAPLSDEHGLNRTAWYADRSLKRHPRFEAYTAAFHVRFEGGAVMNGIHVLTQPNSIYAKGPKPTRGGCAIWDLAAVSLMIQESGGSVQTYGGKPLPLNRPHTVYFNDVGFLMSSGDSGGAHALQQIRLIDASLLE